ncbi:nuclear transport factor 2 family protein [Vreelandella sp.]|uniref:nuclear transport factor 2 family protein n=1 Tax=Vreelandella sp. TaxID=3137778 RepID=UPI003BAA25E8
MNNTQLPDTQPHDVRHVLAFLEAMASRDLPRAQACLTEDAVMQFPGAPAMHQLVSVVEWAKSRYLRVSKTFHGVDHCITPCQSVVICHGELTVEWLDGSTTSGVRFIDRFVLIDGLIARQDVWNDLALNQPLMRPL